MRVSLIAAVLILLHALTASAQIGSGQLTGVVRDQIGAGLPGATVTVTSAATNAVRVVVTTADGVYTAPGLSPGTYRVEAKLSGFKAVRRDGIRLSTGETARLDFTLTVAL